MHVLQYKIIQVCWEAVHRLLLKVNKLRYKASQVHSRVTSDIVTSQKRVNIKKASRLEAASATVGFAADFLPRYLLFFHHSGIKQIVLPVRLTCASPCMPPIMFRVTADTPQHCARLTHVVSLFTMEALSRRRTRTHDTYIFHPYRWSRDKTKERLQPLLFTYAVILNKDTNIPYWNSLRSLCMSLSLWSWDPLSRLWPPN